MLQTSVMLYIKLVQKRTCSYVEMNPKTSSARLGQPSGNAGNYHVAGNAAAGIGGIPSACGPTGGGGTWQLNFGGWFSGSEYPAGDCCVQMEADFIGSTGWAHSWLYEVNPTDMTTGIDSTWAEYPSGTPTGSPGTETMQVIGGAKWGLTTELVCDGNGGVQKLMLNVFNVPDPATGGGKHFCQLQFFICGGKIHLVIFFSDCFYPYLDRGEYCEQEVCCLLLR